MVQMTLRVAVDDRACIGSGNCVEQAPGAFALTDDGVVTVIDTTTVPDDDLLAAEASCPVAAILVSEESPHP
ncbi:MAG: ferredoxin [Actinophytocola sp.]|nr:ferredoxin [Actinophytocola sp.]